MLLLVRSKGTLFGPRANAPQMRPVSVSFMRSRGTVSCLPSDQFSTPLSRQNAFMGKTSATMQRTQESSGKVTSSLVQNDTRSKMTGGYCFASWVIRVCGNLGSAEDSHGRMNPRRPPDFLGTRQPREGSHGTVKLPGKLPANPQIPQTPTILSRSSSKCGASQKITN